MRLIYAGMKARLADGTAIPVRGVLLHPTTGALSYVVVGANGLFGPDVLAPAASIWLVDDAGVHLAVTAQEAAGLPAFHPFAFSSALAAGYRYVARRRASAPLRMVHP
jgi:hypothetical protein